MVHLTKGEHNWSKLEMLSTHGSNYKEALTLTILKLLAVVIFILRKMKQDMTFARQ